MAKKDNSMLMIDIIWWAIIFIMLFLIVYSFLFYQQFWVDWWTLSFSEHCEAIRIWLAYMILK